MPEELDLGRGEGEAPPPPKKKKKKKTSKAAIFFLFLLMLAGTGAGMHIAGAWDARPLVYESIPRIPWVGEEIARRIGIPEEYSLTVEQRRSLELQRWQERLDERERSLADREADLRAVSSEIEARIVAVERREDAVAIRETRMPESVEEEKEYLEMLMRTYQEISPRQAAQIMERLREDLAVKMLLKMPADTRASILARMDAARAARLTERLAAGGSR